MTRSDIRTRILEGLNESSSSPTFWSKAQVDAVIQDAQEVMAQEVGGIKRSAIAALQEGTTYYHTRGIAPDMMVPTRIWIPSLNRRLTATNIGEIDAFHERWHTVTGDPEYWFSMGWDWFGIYPHPSAGGGTMRVDYVAWPQTMLDDDDEPEFLRADHDALTLYGVYEGLLKRWDFTNAMQTFVLFLEKLGKGRARSGPRQLQARHWQQSAQPGTPFRSGSVGRRDG